MTLDMPTKRRWLRPKPEHVLIVAILLVVAVSHGFNMFQFPYYENDEGSYMSQAWSLINEGRLAPYTYWYDHAPGGWIQIAAWILVTGGFHTFGNSVESGRVLMLILQVGSTFMLYRTARVVSGRVWVAALAALLFGLSAYGIYFHRRVLLDNIATFWMLMSILLLVRKPLSLGRVWLSALALGVSALSKELTVVLIPVLAFLVAVHSDRSTRRFAVVGWLALVMSLTSVYIVMAILKGELFPTGTWLGGDHRHVSLVCTLQYQASRARDGGVLDRHSGFWQLVMVWAQDEPLLLIGGSIAAVLSVFMLRRRILTATMGLVTLSLWAFLGRGGVILGFYLVPLLPLLALNLALLAGDVVACLGALLQPRGRARRAAVWGSVLVVFAASLAGLARDYSGPNLGFHNDHLVLWRNQQAEAQTDAVEWAEKNVSPNSGIIIEDSMWIEFRDPPHPNRSFPKAHWYWKVDLDPEIHDDVFHGDWHRVNYVIATPSMVNDTQAAGLQLVGEALSHSTPVVRFDAGGYPVEVRRVDPQQQGIVAPGGAGASSKLGPESQTARPMNGESCSAPRGG